VSDPTIGHLVKEAARQLAAAGIEAPLREARLLLGHAADLPPATIMAWPERSVPAAAVRRFEDFLKRRTAHEPVSRLLGRREFWSLDFQVTAETLDPRPDTETLIEAVLAQLPDRTAPYRLLDLGTGTGCILAALLSELPGASGLGIDRSPAAARIAAANTRRLGFSDRAAFLVGDWAKAIDGRFDIIVSNPPYIATAEIDGLAPEVNQHDPHLALDGGADGLDAYRSLAPVVARLLSPGGIAAVEIGQGQADGVARLFVEADLGMVERRRDLSGIERVVLAWRADEKTRK